MLNSYDTAIFWWINSHHCPACDWIMWVASQGWSHAIVIVFALITIYIKKGWNQWWLLLLGIGLCYLLGDRISVMAFKDVVMRLRPCHALEGVRMFHTHCGGQYGFVSSHAANCFSVAVFLSLVATGGRRRKAAPQKKEYAILPYLMIMWAVLVGYSRPYLGKHYPGDVVCGAILGVAIGALVYFIYCKVLSWIQRRTSSNVSSNDVE